MAIADRSIRAIVALVAIVAVTAALVASLLAGVGGVGGVEPAFAHEKPESRKECKEKRKGSHEWRDHHCGRFG